MEELAHGHQRVIHWNGTVAVDSPVAEGIDHPRFTEHRLTRHLLEGWLMDQRGEVVLVRWATHSSEHPLQLPHPALDFLLQLC